jgi:serine/threonine-protein kinase
MAADLRKTISHPKGGFVRYPKTKEEGGENTRDERKKKAPRPKKTNWKLVIIVCITAILMATTLCGLYLRMSRGTIPMPHLIGAPQAEAVQMIEELGIEVNVVNAYSEEIPGGSVMLQSRAAGELLRKDAQITITVSLGSQWYVLPDMVGMDYEEAIAYLANAGVNTVNVSYAQSDLPTGTIIYQEPHSGHISRDVPVLIKISGQSVSVPSLAGLSLEGARAVIEAEGLVLGTISEGESADAKSGTVIAQSIAPYTQVLSGTSVDMTICRPQEIRYAPDTALTLVVPLNNLQMRVDLVLPSGETVEAYNSILRQGTHSVHMNSTQKGMHTVYIYLEDVLFESLQLDFE